MFFKSTFLIQSVFEDLQLESEISIVGCYCRQNYFSHVTQGIREMLLKTNSTCLLPTGRRGLTWFDWVPWTTWQKGKSILF